MHVDRTPCAGRHTDELVAFERASGPDAPFSADTCWNGPVAAQCYQDLLAYVGLPRDSWPAGLAVGQFDPSADGWAAGDRTVY